MEKQFKLIIVLGILLLLLPLSGLPNSWNMFIASIIGLILLLVAVVFKVNAPLSNKDTSVKETIYIDSKGHVSNNKEDHGDDDNVKEIELNLTPGQEIEINIEEEGDRS